MRQQCVCWGMKALLLASVSAFALGFLAGRALAAPIQANDAESGTREAARRFLLGFILPMWQMAGFADWACHRATRIEENSGTKETLLHLLMLVEMGLPTLAALFLEINAPVLAMMVAAFVAHEATALWDVSYAVTRREVTPLEQHVHSFLEVLPLMAASFLCALHWPQFQELVGAAPRRDWGIRLKRHALPASVVAPTLAGVGALNVAPYLEELWRDLRAHPQLVPPG